MEVCLRFCWSYLHFVPINIIVSFRIQASFQRLMTQNYRVSFIVNIVPQSLKHCPNTHFIERTRIAQPEPQVQSKPGSFIMGFIHKKCEIFSLWTIWGEKNGWARCCELITLGFVSFVCDECEYTQSNLLSSPRLARRMKKWNSSEHSIHVLMSTLNVSVFKNCLTKR